MTLSWMAWVLQTRAKALEMHQTEVKSFSQNYKAFKNCHSLVCPIALKSKYKMHFYLQSITWLYLCIHFFCLCTLTSCYHWSLLVSSFKNTWKLLLANAYCWLHGLIYVMTNRVCNIHCKKKMEQRCICIHIFFLVFCNIRTVTIAPILIVIT